MFNKLLKYVLVGWIVIGFYFQYNYGLADNGDFIRSMRIISPDATGANIDVTAWPNVEAKNVRYYSYWLPYWRFEWWGRTSFSSTQLLWLPGAVLNYFLFSKNVLLMPAISLFPRFLLILVVLLFFKWEEQHQKYVALLGLCIGVPLVLVLSNSAYAAYLNSFYQETGSLIYVFLFLISLIILYQSFNLMNFLVCLVLSILLSTVRQGNIYWPFITSLVLVYIINVKTRLNLVHLIIPGILLLFVTFFISFVNVKAQYADWQSSYEVNQYNSLFLGVLKFSIDPAAHLARIGMKNAIDCVNVSPYSPSGMVCLKTYNEQLSFHKIWDVLIHEPKILLREVIFASGEMQDITIEYLGKYSINDPSSTPRVTEAVNQRYLGQSEKNYLNVWAILKYYFFPRSYFLLLYLLVSFIVFTHNLWHGPILFQELSLIGLVATVATFSDLTVTILAGGVIELIKHLFLANLLFDISFIAFWGLICASIMTLLMGKYSDDPLEKRSRSA